MKAWARTASKRSFSGCWAVNLLSSLFFFQAEDGIRDLTVTGVQTCALPILTVILLAVLVLLFPDGRLPSPRWRPVLWALAVAAAGLVAQQFQAGTWITGRSEERRVGKEWRSRWSPYH